MTQDEDTEYEGISTGIFQNHLRSSQVGTLDLNESFQCSASQASLNLQNGNWANDSLSMLDEETQSNKARTLSFQQPLNSSKGKPLATAIKKDKNVLGLNMSSAPFEETKIAPFEHQQLIL